jgi:UDP-N-acetylmuramoylalanine--D-glutamate ligase
MTNWQGKTILVIGAARQGMAATRFLASHGSQVILTDSRPEQNFIEQTRQFKSLPVRFVFGSHTPELLEKVDGICVSGGVPLDIPLIIQAHKMNIPLTNDAQLFLDLVQAKVIGITGSAGKTTTTTLIGEIAKSGIFPGHKVWVGGNIGNPLIDHVEDMCSEDWVVMELSSFQLELMQTSPSIAVVLNITPNHLDRHKTMRAYTTAKSNILRYQNSLDWAILNRDEPGSFNLKSSVIGKISTFGFNKPKGCLVGTFIEENTLKYFDGKTAISLMPADSVQLLGQHNLMNALAACAAGVTAGFTVSAMQEGIHSVKGIPHRLELIRKFNGIRWYNDSIATAPERVIAALHAIPGPLVLLLGGRDKNLPWTALAAILHEKTPKVIVFGEAGTMIKKVLLDFENDAPEYPISQVNDLRDAVLEASKIADRDSAVLLSPGGTSYDAFLNFEERGNLFKQLVEEIQ